ncbi:MAG: DUF4411 family protein [Deltaproteobacteria bacterium]|jgi:hypothetical protein|nr:DUF4411 family protein [Deltaproteobacteria bacterium]
MDNYPNNIFAKYIIDTCSINSQKSNAKYDRTTFVTLWQKLDDLIRRKEIVIISLIYDEINDEEIKNFVNNINITAIPLSKEIQDMATAIATSSAKKNPKAIDFKNKRSSTAFFMIATAKMYNLTIITEEKDSIQNNIPQIAKDNGVLCYNLYSFRIKNKWTF